MEFFDLTSNDDIATLSPGFVSPAQSNSYSPGNPVRALAGNDTVNGSEANDDTNGNIGDDRIDGLGGDDFIRGGQGNDVVQGSDGRDEVNGNIGNDTVDGGDGDDSGRGGQGDDTVTGGDGADTLFGDFGNDLLTGGSGADVFILQAGKDLDTIADFRPNEDSLGIVNGEVDVANLNAIANGNDTLITDKLSGQTIAVVQGVDSQTIASELGIGTASNLPRRLKIIAQSSRVGASSQPPSFVPVTTSWENFVVGSAGWTANGFIDIADRKFSFSYQALLGDLPETIQLTIDPSSPGSGTLGFASERYGYLWTGIGNPNVPSIEIPLIENSNLSSTRITFTFNSSDVLGFTPLS